MNQMNGSQLPQDRRNALNPPPVCFNCGIPGHFVVACPHPSREVPAGISVLYNQVPDSHNWQVQQRPRPYRQQQSYYPNQHCGANPGALSPSIYNASSSPALSYQLTNHPNHYLASQQNIPNYFSSSNHTSQNLHHGSLSYQAPTPNHPYSNLGSTYQGTSPFVHQSAHQSQWSFSPPGSSDHESWLKAPFSSHQKKFSAAKNLKRQQSYRSVTTCENICGSPSSTGKKNHKYSSEISHNFSPETSRTSYPNKRFKFQKLNLCSDEIANSSEDYIHASSHHSISAQNVIPKAQTHTDDPESQPTKFSVQISKKIKKVSQNKIDQDEELWEWEFNAIFKEPSEVETVELAQPLAASFKSTPVPLTQPWSLLLPSISRYARKENAKEFTRSIRCSPQWSYLQEDPTFADIKLDSPLISLDEILDWIAVRREVGFNFEETSKSINSKNYSLMREKKDESEKKNQSEVDHQIKVDAQCIIEEASPKKRKFESLDAPCDHEYLKVNPVQSRLSQKNSSTEISLDNKHLKNIQESNTAFSVSDTSKNKNHACEVSIFAAYSRRW